MTAPTPLHYAAAPVVLPKRPMVLAILAIAIVTFAGVFGAGTNAVNALISPDYFRSLMGIGWTEAVAHGVLEGAVFGLLFSLVVTATVGCITRASCDYPAAFRLLGWIILADFALWVLGGACGSALAAVAPDFFRENFPIAPDAVGPLIRFAWVGGSIWGAEFAGLLATALILIRFGFVWSRRGVDRARSHL